MELRHRNVSAQLYSLVAKGCKPEIIYFSFKPTLICMEVPMPVVCRGSDIILTFLPHTLPRLGKGN